jgi:thioredoxin 1
VLKEIGSSVCIPCRKMKPILEAIAREYAGTLKVEILEARDHLDQAQKYKVFAIPTQVLVDAEGKVLWKHLGFISKDDLEKVLLQNGIEKKEEKTEKAE